MATYLSLSYINFDTSVPSSVPPAWPTLFNLNDDLMPVDNDNDNIWGPMYHVVISAGLAPFTNDLSIENECLWQEVELLIMESKQYNGLGPEHFEDNAMTTNVAEHLHSFPFALPRVQ